MKDKGDVLRKIRKEEGTCILQMSLKYKYKRYNCVQNYCFYHAHIESNFVIFFANKMCQKIVALNDQFWFSHFL